MSLECVQVSGPFTFSFPTGNFGGAGGQRENDIDAKGDTSNKGGEIKPKAQQGRGRGGRSCRASVPSSKPIDRTRSDPGELEPGTYGGEELADVSKALASITLDLEDVGTH